MTTPVSPGASNLRARLGGLLLAALALVPLLWVQRLVPAGSGPTALGTHTQADLPPCGFEASTGLPCATCGVTTAFTHAAQGNIGSSLATQPLGFTLALMLAMLVVFGGWAAWRGLSPAKLFATMASGRFIALLVAVMLVGWLYRLGWVWLA
ncbi:MAG: DUF2752 domain-containing protein [Phycisphaeraceae bacterium]|nr:DUF2752 domain-containing protein [Phycisphaeraceae bacterium]